MNTVGFIGSRDAGTVARTILAKGECNLCIWQPDGAAEDANELPGEVVELDVLADIPLIIISARVHRFRSIARRLGDIITGRHVIVHTTRGIEAETALTASEILHQETPTRRTGFVTGPSRLDDLQAGRPSAAVCATHFPEVHELVEEAMMSPGFRIYRSRDLLGAELSAVYSRLLAIMSGLADGLQLGASIQATLFARGLAEMSRFVVSRDGYEQTPFGLSGAGNLYVDTHQDGNIDFQMGQFLAKSPDDYSDDLVDNFDEPAQEILDILAAFGEAEAEEEDLELYLFDAAQAIIEAQVPPAKVIQGLMTLPALYE